ncbi:MAG: hypothetical protein AB1664_08545 [Thermodesulfobacteriota bacterium]
MSIMVAEALLRVVTFASSNADRPLYFNLSDPKIILGLMLGMFSPYLMVAIPAAITKWLILRLILQKEARPKVWRLIAVAILEVTYVFVAVAFPELVDVDGLSAFPMSLVPLLVCGALGMLCNLLLLPRWHQRAAAYSLLKKYVFAFGLGLIYWAYMVLILFSFQMVLH